MIKEVYPTRSLPPQSPNKGTESAGQSPAPICLGIRAGIVQDWVLSSGHLGPQRWRWILWSPKPEYSAPSLAIVLSLRLASHAD